MRRRECRKITFGETNGMMYRFRSIGIYHLTWSFAHTEERSGTRVRKYYMETYKAHGRDLMQDDWGNGIHE
jgi:hypothetical protein